MKHIDKYIAFDKQEFNVESGLDYSLIASGFEINQKIASYMEIINNKKELICRIMVGYLNYNERDIVSKLNDISNYPLYNNEIFRSARRQVCLNPLRNTFTTCLYTLTELLNKHNIRKSHNNFSEQEIEQIYEGVLKENACFKIKCGSEKLPRSLSV